MGERVRITKEVVDGAEKGERDRIIWDKAISGFGLKVTPAGRKTYFLYYRTKSGQQRRPTIDTHGNVTADEARKIAKLWAGIVAGGGDPSKERQDARREETIADLAARYLTDYAKPHKKKRTYEEDNRNLTKHILPALGRIKIGAISREDVARFHNSRKTQPANANRCLSILSHVLTMAEKWGLRSDGSNPCRHVERFPEKGRERLLSPEELGRLGDALTSMAPAPGAALEPLAQKTKKKGAPSRQLVARHRDAAGRYEDAPEDWRSIACIRLLLLTGGRLSEILTLRWEWVDFQRGVARLPDSKTGAKNLPLSAPALVLLQHLSGSDGSPSGYVLPGDREGEYFKGIQKSWQRIRKAAELADVRLHDLRHAFASIAVAAGDSLFLVGKVLGHRQASTTERYAHLAPDPIRAVSDRTAERIAALLSGATADNVVPLRPVSGRS